MAQFVFLKYGTEHWWHGMEAFLGETLNLTRHEHTYHHQPALEPPAEVPDPDDDEPTPPPPRRPGGWGWLVLTVIVGAIALWARPSGPHLLPALERYGELNMWQPFLFLTSAAPAGSTPEVGGKRMCHSLLLCLSCSLSLALSFSCPLLWSCWVLPLRCSNKNTHIHRILRGERVPSVIGYVPHGTCVVVLCATGRATPTRLHISLAADQ